MYSTVQYSPYLNIAAVLLFVFSGLTAGLPGESSRQEILNSPNPEIFGIVGLDPWYTFDADKVNYPGDVNKALLERMASDLSRMGARWIRIEFHAETTSEQGPGPIDYGKYDWFVNELAPRYGLNILAVFGSGMVGAVDETWEFLRINDPIDPSGTNYYINAYLDRAIEVMAHYGSRIQAVEVLNEPNANTILSIQSQGQIKSVIPANYGELLRRTFEVVKSHSASTTVVVGGVLFDDENGTSYDLRGRSYDMDWLERVYGSRAVRSYQADFGRFPFDAIAVHPYFMEPQQIIEYLLEARAMQERFGDDSGRIWITEVGWPAEPPEDAGVLGLALPSPSEREQASFMSALYTTVQQCAPFVDRIFWFKYEDFPVDGEFNGWGLVRLEGASNEYGTFANPWPRKFAFAVYQALASPHYLPVAPIESEEAPDGARYFARTGHALDEPFLTYWRNHGAEVRLGLPITEPFDKGGRLVQYFEKARLEFYPDLVGTEQEVQLGLLGRYLVESRSLMTESTGDRQRPSSQYFSETGHGISGAFGQYWARFGGMTAFGYPLTGEFVEDGLLVQYFERARFEYWPAMDGVGFEVRLGKIGAEAISIPGWYR